jgi:GNAT superfamily N-acetyltransferase
MLPTRSLLRLATLADVDALRELIALSARELSRDCYTTEKIEAALRGAWGVDTQLIRDGTYVVVERGRQFAGCGGWSRRRTLFGADSETHRDSSGLDPRVDAAKIRAFFVHPAFARQGIGSAILEYCEEKAWAAGFRRFELMATLPGRRLYEARGYVAAEPIQWNLGDGLTIEFVPMSKQAAT